MGRGNSYNVGLFSMIWGMRTGYACGREEKCEEFGIILHYFSVPAVCVPSTHIPCGHMRTRYACGKWWVIIKHYFHSHFPALCILGTHIQSHAKRSENSVEQSDIFTLFPSCCMRTGYAWRKLCAIITKCFCFLAAQSNHTTSVFSLPIACVPSTHIPGGVE